MTFYLFSVCDNCTQWLLDDLDYTTSRFSKIYSDFMTVDRIYELYKHIDGLNNQTIFLDNALNEYVKTQDKVKLISIEPFHAAHRTVLTLKREHLLEKIDEMNAEVANVKTDVDHRLQNLEKVTDNILDMIDDLDSTGTEHVEVKKALEEGSSEVQDIREIKMPVHKVLKIQQYCNDLLNFIRHLKQMNYMHPKDVQQDLDYFRKRLNDMRKYIHKTFDHIDQVENYSANVGDRIEDLRNSIRKINRYYNNTTEIKKYQNDIAKANLDFQETEQIYDTMMDSVDSFEDQLDVLEQKIDESNKENELRRVLRKAKEHADMLLKLAKDYNE